MEITGKIIAILPTQSGQGRNGEWVKNQFVIEWNDNNYTQKLCLEVVGAEKFEKMKNAIRVGNEVVVRFSVSSREWNQKWFTSCTCFYCATVGGTQPAQQNQQQQAPQQSAPQTQDAGEESLPF